MQFTVCVFGLELLSIHISTDEETAEEDGTELAGGTTSSTPMGFVPSFGDQRWEQGPGAGEV